MTNKYEPTELAEAVAGVLRGVIGRERITQSALAEATGISQSHISKLMRALRPMDLDTLDRIAVLIGVNASEILAEAESDLAKAQRSNVHSFQAHADNKRVAGRQASTESILEDLEGKPYAADVRRDHEDDPTEL